MEAQGPPPPSHICRALLAQSFSSLLPYVTQRPCGTIRDGDPRTSTSTFTPHLSSDRLALLLHCCFSSTDTVGTVRDGEPRTATSTFTPHLSSDRLALLLHCCFSSADTVGTVRDGEPRTSTSTTFTRLLNSQ